MHECNECNTSYTVRDFSKIPLIIREAAQRGEQNVSIAIESGIYEVEGIRLSSIKDMRVNIRAAGEVRLHGGRRLHGFIPVSNPAILARIAPGAREHILQCDLTANGAATVGEFVSRGFKRPVVPSHAEVFFNTRPMNLAQYPKKGNYLQIDHMEKMHLDEWNNRVGSLEDGFYYDDKHPSVWQKSDDIWLHGYWAYDWANSYERVAELDTDQQFLKTAAPYGNFYFRAGQRFCFLNILEEVTDPGDYYIDREHNLLYFIPFEGEQIDEVILSMNDQPIFTLDGMRNICIEGFTIEAVRGHAITVTGGGDVTIKDCHFRNIGNYAVSISHAVSVEVSGCTIHDCGDGGIEALAGDRLTLDPADICFYNNYIYRIAQWTRCYQPAILMTGVGMSATHNLIHDCPHTAIMYWGNDMTIESNEIYNVVMETGDAGAIYAGRDYTFRGNRVYHNFVHHIGGVGLGAMGIYNDDCLSGTDMEENVFFEVSRAVFLGGGRDFIVKNNTMVNCYPAIRIDSRGASENPNWRGCIRLMRERLYHITNIDNTNMPIEKSKQPEEILPVYLNRYPELRDIDAFYKKEAEPMIPPSGVLEGNIICSNRGIEFLHESEYGEFLIKRHYYANPEEFMDFDFCNFTLKDLSNAQRFDHKAVDMNTIGLVETERTNNPAKVFAKLTAGIGKIEITLKNCSTTCCEDNVVFHTSCPVKGVSGEMLHVKVQAGEKAAFILSVEELPADLEVEARSATGEIRPARLKITK